MRILGIDPGTGRTGYGVIDILPLKDLSEGRSAPLLHEASVPLNASLVTFGCIETPKEDAMPKRLIAIRHAIIDLVAQYTPDVVSIEQLFFGVNSRTAMSVGQARGVVIETVAEDDLPIFEYQGLSVKRIISGSGKSDKKAMQEIIRSFFALETIPKPDDAADGVAIALCHAIAVAESL